MHLKVGITRRNCLSGEGFLRRSAWTPGRRPSVPAPTRMNQWNLEPGRYLPDAELRELTLATEARARAARHQRRRTPVRDWVAIDLLLSSGLRAKELSELRCGEVFLDGDFAQLHVRVGKRKGVRRKRGFWNREEEAPPNPRVVYLDGEIRAHLAEYLAWKRRVGEPTGPEDPLIYSGRRRGPMSVSGIERLFKRCARLAGLSPAYSVHCTRHTYARLLYKAADYDLLYVQKALGHTTVRTTEVYARAFDPRREEIQRRFSELLRRPGTA